MTYKTKRPLRCWRAGTGNLGGNLNTITNVSYSRLTFLTRKVNMELLSNDNGFMGGAVNAENAI